MRPANRGLAVILAACTAAVVALPVVVPHAHAQPPIQPTRILLLYGPAPEAPSIALFTQRLRQTMRAEVTSRVEFYEEHLDLDRFPGRERWPQLARYFADKYRGFRLDAIVAVGSVALQFTNGRLAALLPGVPVVFALTLAPQVDVAAQPPNVTGRLADVPLAATLALARRLQPDLERVVVVGGASAIDSVGVSAAIHGLGAMRDSVRLVVLQGLSQEALLAELRRLPPRTIVFLAYFRRDQRGRIFFTGEFVSTVSRESRVPVYGFMRPWIGEGIVGGAVIRPDDEGVRTARLIMRVLRRRPGEPMPPVEFASSVFVADWRQLRRWGLSEHRLPPGTQLLFRTPTVWERYRGPILGASALFVAQSLLIGLLLLERRRRIHAQLVVADQLAYEQTIAELTTDAAHHATDDEPRALEDAIARIGRYADASTVNLIEYADVPFRPPTRLVWAARPSGTNGNDSALTAPTASGTGHSRLEIPLVADGAPIGMLELHRSDHDAAWPPRLVGRLDAAGELIAGALARSRAARAIRRGEELNRAVLASLSTQLAILDRSGRIIRVNDAWREVGRRAGVDSSRDAFLGENYLDECRRAEARGCDEARDVRLGIESVLERQAGPFRREYHSAPPVERWYELSVERFEHADGGAIVTHLDITDRRLAELKAEETMRHVAHMGRVATVSELAAAVSHELRQPLTAIRANAEAGLLVLSNDSADVAEAKEMFRDIVVDDIRASNVIDHIRTLLRKGELPMSVVDLNAICREAVRLLRGGAERRRTRLHLSLEPALPAIAGDPVQLQQVVLNLTLNAIDAASTSVEDRAVTVGTAARENEVEIFVRDTGSGLPPDVQQHLFESFFSTKAQGLGMGLVIVRSIVERHHGRIHAENDVAGGAVFRVLIPVPRVTERLERRG